ncbi:MAG: dUTP diphosphatase [Thermoanaerobaculales bacterium]|nr:dUTP diphosphatase [Thermoanaerobaculales bacterium]
MNQRSAPVDIRVCRLGHGEGIDLPSYATVGASGADVRSAEAGQVTIEPGERVALATGLIFEIPEGWEVQVRPRSGLAWKKGLTVVNAPGTIDADYRGEVKILLVNLGAEPVVVERAERIAQLVVAPVIQASFVETRDLSSTDRGGGGFGSTGRD